MKKFKFIFIVVGYFFISNTFSGEIKVLKVKGNKATVQFHGQNLEENSVYKILDPSTISDERGGSEFKKNTNRKFGLGIDLSFSSTSANLVIGNNTTESPSTSIVNALISFVGVYLDGFLEFGPNFWMSVSSGEEDSSSYAGGALLVMNFIKNKAGNKIVPGISVKANYGILDLGEDSLNGYILNPNLQLQLFLFGDNNSALKLSAGYNYSSYTYEDSAKLNLSGIVSALGFNIYF